MAIHILKNKLFNILSRYHIVGETTDVSNQEQVAFCLCWVAQEFDVPEEILGI